MAVPTVLAGSAHELLDLALGKIAAFDCEVFSVRCAASGYLIYHDKSLFCKLTGKIIAFFFTVWLGFIFCPVFFRDWKGK
jgi:hypothetical protein